MARAGPFPRRARPPPSLKRQTKDAISHDDDEENELEKRAGSVADRVCADAADPAARPLRDRAARDRLQPLHHGRRREPRRRPEGGRLETGREPVGGGDRRNARIGHEPSAVEARGRRLVQLGGRRRRERHRHLSLFSEPPRDRREDGDPDEQDHGATRMTYARTPRGAGSQAGQSTVLGVLFLAVLIAMMAAVLDVGSWMRTDRSLQSEADAAALAAAQELPDTPATAVTKAIEYGGKNGGHVGAGNVQIKTTVLANDTVKVTIQRTVAGVF